MKQFAYMVTDNYDKLNELGLRGWELVSVVLVAGTDINTHKSIYYLKKEINNKPDDPLQ